MPLERVGDYQYKKVYSFHHLAFGCYRYIKTVELPDPPDKDKKFPEPCPNCGYDSFEFPHNYVYPFHRYCPACEFIMLWSVAICPDCRGFTMNDSRFHPRTYVWCEGVDRAEYWEILPQGQLICGPCREIFDQPFIEEFNDAKYAGRLHEFGFDV